MLMMPAWALCVQLFGAGGWWWSGSPLLTFIAVVALALEVWMLIEAALMWPRVKGVLEETLPPLERSGAMAAAGSRTNC
jgi:carbon starvation protein